eukprot:gnl/TRDRNA2_/TRDRNA2_176654_c0_seq2.p2 gnl/TRDRNA2_/TRDRNA2_176654_c0~~gnl/TRDRNA2_/TRDRNA2_176654_c0_seq2.p2  ORF type:complete len:157 (-),score=4.46 gnl/TRDRNA2_/TRDRNA2_176654_c0_seq2:46-516(-)
MATFNSQNCANRPWAALVSEIKGEALLGLSGGASSCEVQEFSGQDLASSAQEPATEASYQHSASKATCGSDMPCVGLFSAQGLTGIVWASSVLAFTNVPLREALAAAAIRRLTMFNARQLANISWAIAIFEYSDHPMRYSIAAPVHSLWCPLPSGC